MSPIDKQKRTDFYLQKIESIPSLPNVVIELIKLIDNPMTSITQIENLLARDQGLTLKALRLANSAYFAIPGGATTLKRAITYLGLNNIKQLVISASVFDAFKKLDSPEFNLQEFWKHSMATAVISEIIAKEIKSQTADEIFVCGLIHDVGKLALLMIDKAEVIETAKFAKEKSLTFYQSELQREAPQHTYWGGVLAKKWKLPPLLQSAIKDHHSTNHNLRTLNNLEINTVIDIVYISNQLVRALAFGNSGYDIQPTLNQDVLNRLNIKHEDKEPWVLKVKESLAHAETLVKELLK